MRELQESLEEMKAWCDDAVFQSAKDSPSNRIL